MANSVSVAGSSPVLLAGVSPQPVAARTASASPSSAPTSSASPSAPGSAAEAVAHVNLHLQQAQPELKLQVDAGSGRTVFQVIQQGTGQVLLQVPSEEVLGMSRRVRELEGQPGALVDKEG